MKKILLTRVAILGLAGTVAFSTIAPGFANAKDASKNTNQESHLQLDDYSLEFSEEVNELTALEEMMLEDGVTEAELVEFGELVKAEIAPGPDEMVIQWRGAVVKKAVKYMVDHADIIPGKSLRDFVKKNGKKIINAIDTAEAYTWYGLHKAFSKVGIPDRYADALADFIVKFLL